MRPLARLLSPRKSTFSQPPFWSQTSEIWPTSSGERERIEANFEGYVQGAYKQNGIIFACILARMLVFSEARFTWRRFVKGRPTDVFGTPELALLERPWPNGTTGELLAHMEQDGSLAGNFYATKVGTGIETRLRRLRPDWVTIVTGSESDDPYALDAQPIAYIYEPRHTTRVKANPEVLLPGEVAHFSPIPDPTAQWRGMSWLTPIIEEIQADSAATRHKKKFFEHGAIPGLVITYEKDISKEAFEAFVAKFRATHEGADRAYKTLHLAGGVDAKAVGADVKHLDIKQVQGSGETRIAAAAGVHPVIVGLSEGLAGSSLNAGNFGAARRRFADGTIRPLWRTAAASLEVLVRKPDAATSLWYDDRDVPFLREDAKEEAEILNQEAITIKQLVDAGFDADRVIEAVAARDLRRLAGAHSGLFSVQLQPPGMVDAATNGNGNGAVNLEAIREALRKDDRAQLRRELDKARAPREFRVKRTREGWVEGIEEVAAK
jgi:phage portal protein BeeE